MSSVLSKFNAKSFAKYLKNSGYEEGYEAGALLSTIISLYLKGKLTKADS